MKHFFTIIFMSVLLLMGTAYAGGSYHTDNASGAGWATDPDKSFSQSHYGNDWAKADALGGGGFNVYAETTGRDFAGATVEGSTAKGYADTCTYARDFGYSSEAGSFSEVTGWGWAEGSTLAGKTDWRGRGVDSTIEGNTFFNAQVQQGNYAGETGYSAGWVEGGNKSFASINNGADFSDYNDFYGLNSESGYTEGEIYTRGRTKVSIDPTGNYRGFSAETTTNSYADTNHCGDSSSTYMSGDGFVAGSIQNQYGAYAAGSANFNYSGNTDSAQGAANINAQIKKTSNSTTVTVDANSFSRFGNTPR